MKKIGFEIRSQGMWCLDTSSGLYPYGIHVLNRPLLAVSVVFAGFCLVLFVFAVRHFAQRGRQPQKNDGETKNEDSINSSTTRICVRFLLFRTSFFLLLLCLPSDNVSYMIAPCSILT